MHQQLCGEKKLTHFDEPDQTATFAVQFENMQQNDVKNAVDVLRAGGTILYPTDTIWGLGCDATSKDAVEKLVSIKGREPGKPMLVIVDSLATLERYVDDIPDAAYSLIEAAVKPLTLILDHPSGIAPQLLGADGSLGIRISSEEFSKEICKRLRKPIVSTSANFSGEKAPASFADISPLLIEKVDYTASSGRDLCNSMPSDIIKISDGGIIKIIR